jgi:type II secretory pathway component PulK
MILRPVRSDRPGYVIIAVLVVVVVLSLAAYQYTELMTAEYRGNVRQADAVQARHAAVSGVHYAAATLADPDSFYGELGGNPFIDGAFDEQIVRPGPVPRAEARFQLVAVVKNSSGTFEQRYGAVIDEGSKLNVNALIQSDPSGELLAAALTMLQQQLAAASLPCADLLTPDVIDAIVDWVDPDDDPRTSGAESSTYLQNPGGGYRAKNGPLNSLDELLLVKGVTPQLLYGNDRNRNGVADDGASGSLDRGLSDYLTVYGRELNLDSTGVLREYVNNTDDLPGIYQRLQMRVGADVAAYVLGAILFGTSAVPTSTTATAGAAASMPQGSTADLDAAVQAALSADTVKVKGQIKLLNLLNTQITLPKAADAPNNAPTVIVPSPFNADLGKFGALLDGASDTTAVELSPRINVNTAPKEVLMALTVMAGSSSGGTASTGAAPSTSGTSPSTGTAATGLTEADVDNIIAQRQNLNPADPASLTGAWLLTTGGMSPTTFKLIQKLITGRSTVFRVHSIGYFADGGPTARVEAVIDTNQGAPRILYFRDMTDLDSPRGFDPPKQ